MSIIQKIRDKAAWIIIGAIALALIAFIVQDAFQGSGGGWFSSNSTTIGKVNGNKIDYVDFDLRYRMEEEKYKRRNITLNDEQRNQVRDMLWNDYVESTILEEEYEKLGFTLTKKEMDDYLYGNNPPQQLAQAFTDSFGRYNGAMARQTINSYQKNTPQYEYFHNDFLPAESKRHMREKLTTMIGNSFYVPKWMVEKTNAENSQISSVSFVTVPYATIADSTVKISDDEIKKYVDAHKDNYKQEESRSIQYVAFDASPSKADSQDIYNQVASLKDQFASSKDPQNFIISNNGDMQYYDGYVIGTRMQMENADTIRKLPDGAVLGPYLDGTSYVMAKMIDRKMIPDSVKCRHILIKIGDQESGLIRSDTAAKKLIDSLEGAIKAGTSFDSLVTKFSEDGGSRATKGEYTFGFAGIGNISKEFGEVIFYGSTGDKKVVRVENQQYIGYHYIEVLKQWNFEQGYKVAYYSRPILPSDNTINAANSLAAQFVAESRNQKQFNDNAQKRKYTVKTAVEIKPLASTIMGIDGDNRSMVKWIYEADKGDIAEQSYQLGDQFIVPMVTEIYEKGTMSPDKARPLVEYRLRNDKKAEQIIKKIGNAKDMDAVVKATGIPAQRADSIRFSGGGNSTIGNESKVIGAAFNPDYKSPNVSPPVKGLFGVYVLSVENISAVSNPAFDIKMQQMIMQKQQAGQLGNSTLELIKKSADITDNRAKFF